MRKATSLFVGCLLTTILNTTVWADDKESYKITITNLTPGQPFAPILAASHQGGMSFFEIGQPPSNELAMLAEAGNNNPLAAKLITLPGVSDVQISTTGLTFPGKSTTLMITAIRTVNLFSLPNQHPAADAAFLVMRK